MIKTHITLLLFVLILVSSAAVGQTNDQFLVLVNGDTIRGKVELKQPFLRGTYALVDDSLKYKLNQVLKIQTEEAHYARHRSTFNKNRLVRRVERGNIDLFVDNTKNYSHSPTLNVGGGVGVGFSPTGGFYKSMFFSKDNGEIQKVNHANLSKALSDNLESQQHLNTYKKFTYAKIGSIVGGLAIIGTSFIGVDQENPPKVGLIVLGGVVANLGWIFHMAQSDKIEKAIREYNQEY